MTLYFGRGQYKHNNALVATMRAFDTIVEVSQKMSCIARFVLTFDRSLHNEYRKNSDI